ncbi:MAG: dihydrofolate reductase family protein [Ignavibacteriales bacterium]|nr:dihydrofolate reductase family protein [Ignavibacteriales bacterium]
MRKIILSMHTSLDGFVGGKNGELDWIKFNDEMFDLVGKFSDEADAALYGRVTYQMMENYWPTAADKPAPTKHEIEHSNWYNKVTKIVLSRSMQGKHLSNTIFISENIPNEINKLKQQKGKDILIFGSPTAVHHLMQFNLIDDFWLFLNPIILGQGIPLFAGIKDKIKLKLLTTKEFSCGVTGLNYTIDK